MYVGMNVPHHFWSYKYFSFNFIIFFHFISFLGLGLYKQAKLSKHSLVGFLPGEAAMLYGKAYLDYY
jgi:hypothetical protein